MSEQARSVFDAAIATKILQHISRVRDSSHDGQARRWIWELIQNAKDASFPGEPVKIRVRLTPQELIFSHNGRPFNVKGILSIINQVSSKQPDNEETTGKFGTGFVTTHLLSEVVRLKSVLSDSDSSTDEELPYKAFEVALDRSGVDQEEVLDAVNRAINVIEEIDKTPDVDFDKDSYNTSFIYELKTDKSKEIAGLGLDDLKYSIVYALAFVKNIAQIEIINDITDESRLFTIASKTPTDTEEITQLCVNEVNNNSTIEHYMLLAQRGKTVVVAPTDSNNNFTPVDPNTPRVFVDFPLIGSEKFPFPAVCNSSDFQPDEPRSFIPVNDREESFNSNANKEILLECMELYRLILIEANEQGYSNFYNVVSFGEIITRPDLHPQWIYDNIFENMLEYIKEIPVFKVLNKGQVPLSDELHFPMSKNKKELGVLSDILNMIDGYSVPLKKDLQGWYNSFKHLPELDSSRFMDLSDVVDQISEFTLKDDITRLNFVQTVYDAVLENASLLKDFASGTLALIPDQSDEMTLRKAKDIYQDIGIDENFKESIHLLNQYSITNREDLDEMLIYEKLVHKDFELRDCNAVLEAPINNYTNYIKNKTEIVYNRANIRSAFFQLICCCEDDCWYNFAKVYYPEYMEGRVFKTSNFFSDDIWRNTIVYIIKCINDMIEDVVDLEGLNSSYFIEKSIDDTASELRKYILKASAITSKIFENEIFPNQYNNFKSMNELKFEAEDVSKELKDIAQKLSATSGKDYYSMLLRKDLGTFSKSKSTSITNKDIAINISDTVNETLNQMSLFEAEDDIQIACTLLLSWINENDGLAQKLFTAFYSEENRMKLLTPKSATILSKKVKEFDNLLDEFGFGSLEEAREMLSKYQTLETAAENHTIESQHESYINFSDPYYDGWSAEQKETYAQKVGSTGELFAFELLRQKWLDNGYDENRIDSRTIVFDKDDESIELFYGDTDNYKQAGWDIRETLNENPAIYYEVKSTVVEDRTHYINLTRSQASNALSMPDRFNVISMHLTKNLSTTIKHTIYDNILDKIKRQELQMLHQGMVLLVP